MIKFKKTKDKVAVICVVSNNEIANLKNLNKKKIKQKQLNLKI